MPFAVAEATPACLCRCAALGGIKRILVTAWFPNRGLTYEKRCMYLLSMWESLEHRRNWKELDRLPLDILKHYDKWKDIVRLSGPHGLRHIREFNDEALSGEWQGQHFSRLSRQYRVIYRLERDKVLIEVLSVTAHGYR